MISLYHDPNIEQLFLLSVSKVLEESVSVYTMVFIGANRDMQDTFKSFVKSKKRDYRIQGINYSEIMKIVWNKSAKHLKRELCNNQAAWLDVKYRLKRALEMTKEQNLQNHPGMMFTSTQVLYLIQEAKK